MKNDNSARISRGKGHEAIREYEIVFTLCVSRFVFNMFESWYLMC